MLLLVSVRKRKLRLHSCHHPLPFAFMILVSLNITLKCHLLCLIMKLIVALNPKEPLVVFCVVAPTQPVHTVFAGYNQIYHNISLLVLGLSRSMVYLQLVLYIRIRKSELKGNSLARWERAQKFLFYLSRARCLPAYMHLWFFDPVSNPSLSNTLFKALVNRYGFNLCVESACF